MDAGIKVGRPLVGTWRTIGQDSSAHIKEFMDSFRDPDYRA